MMGKLTGLCVLLLLSVLNVAVNQDTVTPAYFTDGGDLTLKVRPAFPDHINDILWKFNGYLLAEWVENKVPLGYYPRIEGRANLTTETGQLIINNMRKDDEGVYSVEINGRVQSERYRAKLIKKVQMPKLEKRTCTFESMSCKFSCDSNTTEAEPVSYSWKKEDGEWEVSGKDINIKWFTFWSTFTCRIENPVSQEESDPEHNPFYKLSILLVILSGAVVVVFLLLGLFVMIGSFKNRCSNITHPAHGNGDVQPSAHPSDSSICETIPLQDNP